MARVLDRREATGVPAGRGLVERGGRLAPEKLVRALVVVENTEPVEGALLGGQVRLGRPRRRGLEGPMHPLVGPVLLRTGGQNPLMLQAQPDPPDVELREAVDAGRGE